MESLFSNLKVALAALTGGLAWFWGPWDALLLVLIAFIALDYISGIVCGALRGELSSAVGFKGLIKKMGIFVVVTVACLTERIIPAANGALRAAACMFFVANEGLSILENWARIGLPLPEVIRQTLSQMKDENKSHS